MNIIRFCCFALCLALACRLSLADDLDQNGIDQPCTRRDGLPGYCVLKQDCRKVMQIFKRLRNKLPISTTDRLYARNSLLQDRKYVCCEEEEGVKILSEQDCGYFGDEKKTVGGFEVKLMARPWMALLKFRRNDIDEFTCGGTLISNRFVLTAAHCFKDQTLLYVRLGEHQISNETDCIFIRNRKICAPPVQDVKFDQIFVHENYSQLTAENDIALVKLAENISNSISIRPICLPLTGTLQRQPEDMEKFHVTGWGRTEHENLSDLPMETAVSNKNRIICQNAFDREITSGQLCAGNRGHDSCNGDSGGPLAYFTEYKGYQRFVQFGIVSYGSAQCGNGYPGVYTNVGQYISWIADKLVAN